MLAQARPPSLRNVEKLLDRQDMDNSNAKIRLARPAAQAKAQQEQVGSPFSLASHDFSGKETTASNDGKTVAAVLGEIVWLMSQSARHKTFMIQDLEAAVMPAVLLRQFRIYYDTKTPAGVVLFARVNADTAARLDAGAPSLRPTDWQSGSQVRIVDIIAPFGGREDIEAEFIRTVGSVSQT